MNKKEIFFILSSLDVGKYMYTNAKVLLFAIIPMIVIAVIVFVTGLLQSPALLHNLEAVVTFFAIFAFIVIFPFITVYISSGHRYIGYWAEDCTLYVRTMGTLKIPLDKAEVRLVPYEEYKPVLRTWGVGVPGMVYGKVILRGGRKGIALVFRPQKDAILITYQNMTIVISHPGIRESYEKLLRYQEACIRRGG